MIYIKSHIQPFKQIPMSATNQAGLATVQTLYLMQIDLAQYLRYGIKTGNQMEKARKQLSDFRKFLKEADWKYMGGEDVYQELCAIQEEVAAKIKEKEKRMQN